jgi:hypothetical protein
MFAPRDMRIRLNSIPDIRFLFCLSGARKIFELGLGGGKEMVPRLEMRDFGEAKRGEAEFGDIGLY